MLIQASEKVTKSWRVAVVTALFNEKWTKKLEAGALETLKSQGLEPVARVYVPGAVEIPLAVKGLLEKDHCDAVVALGVVIRGETSHYDYVCNSVERGCSELQLQFSKPVAFGVLTTENKEQVKARCGGKKGNKGGEAAQVALDMLHVMEQISTLKE